MLQTYPFEGKKCETTEKLAILSWGWNINL